MGDMRRVLITGASGFIGTETVAAVRSAGLEPVPVTRQSVDLSAPDAEERLAELMRGCQSVIHLAAAMGGDAETHERVTVEGTQSVINAMQSAGVGHLVLVSSMAVYRLEDLFEGENLTSDSGLDTPETARDAYAHAKLRQEVLAKEAGIRNLTILRPGIVYDEDHIWNAHLGVGVGPVLVGFPGDTALPMCHVTHLADRITTAVSDRKPTAELVLDPELPSRGNVIRALRRSGWPKIVLPFPWSIMRALAGLFAPLQQRLPGLLRPRVLDQRLYPLGRVTTKGDLQWQPTGGTA